MVIVILVITVLTMGIGIGFMIGFSRSMREAAVKVHGIKNPVGGWVAITLGSLGLLFALGSWIYLLHFTHVAVHSSGTVVEMQQQTDKDGTISYSPTFRFRDEVGAEQTVSSSLYASPPEFHIGDTVTVLYSHGNPQSARIDSFWQLWGLPSLAGFAGSVTFLVGLIMISWRKIICRAF